jgi:hypothetical protein
LHARRTSACSHGIQCHCRPAAVLLCCSAALLLCPPPSTRLVSIPAPQKPRRARLLEACRNKHGGAALEGDYIVPPYGPCLRHTEQPCGPLASRPGISLAAVKSLAQAGLCLRRSTVPDLRELQQVHQHRRRHVGAARHRHASPSGISTSTAPAQHQHSTRAAQTLQAAAVCNVSLDLRVLPVPPTRYLPAFLRLHYPSGNSLSTLNV